MNPLMLKNKNIFSTLQILKDVLGHSYKVFEEQRTEFTDSVIVTEWQYYNDSKAWLCKLMCKRKSLGWFHVYNIFFTVSCFFAEKHLKQ